MAAAARTVAARAAAARAAAPAARAVRRAAPGGPVGMVTVEEARVEAT